MMISFFRKYAATASLFLTAIFLWPNATHGHNVYNSFSQIEWNPGDSSIELVVQIHSHELETKLSIQLDERLSFLEDADFPVLEQATGDFLKQNLFLQLDGQPVDLIFLGIETDGQTVYAYLEQDWENTPIAIEFMNSMFLDDLAGQVNSVLATVDGVRQGADILADSEPVKFLF